MISWMAALDGRQKMMSASMGQEMRNGIDGSEKNHIYPCLNLILVK
jgi:hypothetical protein